MVEKFIRAYVHGRGQETMLSSSDEEGQIQQLKMRICADKKRLNHLRRKQGTKNASRALSLVMDNLVTEA